MIKVRNVLKRRPKGKSLNATPREEAISILEKAMFVVNLKRKKKGLEPHKLNEFMPKEQRELIINNYVKSYSPLKRLLRNSTFKNGEPVIKQIY